MNLNYSENKVYTAPSLTILELIIEQPIFSGSNTIDDLTIFDLD